MIGDDDLEGLLREHAPRVLGALLRRNADFEAAEDAVQDALLAAATQWPSQGVPDRPDGWLITVANRRLVDQIRSESAAAAASRTTPPARRRTSSSPRRRERHHRPVTTR